VDVIVGKTQLNGYLAFFIFSFLFGLSTGTLKLSFSVFIVDCQFYLKKKILD